MHLPGLKPFNSMAISSSNFQSQQLVPNFCVGVQRGATTYLYEMLAKYSNASLSPFKEVHYFDTSHPGSVDKYHAHFKDISRAVDITPSYSVMRSRLERIYNYNHSAKLLFIERSPVQRIVSHYLYYSNRYPGAGSFDQFLASNIDYCVSRCAYGSIKKAIVDLFGPSSLLVIDYDTLVNVPDLSIKQISSFFGLVYNNYGKELTSTPTNSSLGVRERVLFRYARFLYKKLPLRIPHSIKTSGVEVIDRVVNALSVTRSSQPSPDLQFLHNKALHYISSIDLDALWSLQD